MKKTRHYLLILFLLSLIACEDDNNPDDIIPPDTQKFTVITNDTYVSDIKRKWVLVYDSNNNLLAEKELENNKEIILEWESGDNDSPLMIQLITFLYTDYSESYTIDNFTDIESDIWHLNGSIAAEKPGTLGSNKVEFTDFDYNAYTYRIIQNLGKGTTALGDDYFYIYQHFNPDNIWMCFYNPGENPTYKLVENVSLNENFSFSSDDFSPMENYVEYEFPESTVSDIIIWSDQSFYDGLNIGFRLYNNTQFGSSTSIRGYYPGDLFSGYYLNTYFSTGNVFENMRFRGATLPEEFIRMETSEEISNTSIFDFNSLVNAEAEYMKHEWNNVMIEEGSVSRFFYYKVFSPVSQNFNFVAPELPEHIADLDNELIDLSNLQFRSTTFRKTDPFNSYDDFVNEQFVNPEVVDDFSIQLTKIISYQD